AACRSDGAPWLRRGPPCLRRDTRTRRSRNPRTHQEKTKESSCISWSSCASCPAGGTGGFRRERGGPCRCGQEMTTGAKSTDNQAKPRYRSGASPMAARPTWKGFLKISLVNIPIRVFPATDSAATISFNQLHAECQTRIQQKRWCPTCQREVPNT